MGMVVCGLEYHCGGSNGVKDMSGSFRCWLAGRFC